MLPGYLADVIRLNKQGVKELVVLRIRPIPTQFPTNSGFTLVDKLYTKCVILEGVEFMLV